MTAQIIPVPVFDLVVFGATGDLSFRKLMPALYWRERDQQMPPGSRIIAVARAELTTADYVAKVEAACREHVDGAGFEPAVFAPVEHASRAALADLHQAGLLQPLQRLANRVAVDPEPLGEDALGGNRGAGLHRPAEDLLAQTLVDNL